MKQFPRKFFTWLTVLFLLICCLAPTLVFAESQMVPMVSEVPVTEAPAPVTATPNVTDTPTPAAIVVPASEMTAIPTPTPEAAAAPTPEATVVPNSEATAALTPEATVAPTSEATTALTPEATVTPAPGTSEKNCLPLSLGEEYHGVLTGDLPTLYLELDACGERKNITVTTSGLAVTVLMVNLDNETSTKLTPDMKDGEYVPLDETLTLDQGISYRLEIRAAHDGNTGDFRLLIAEVLDETNETDVPFGNEPSDELAEEAIEEPAVESTGDVEATEEPTVEPTAESTETLAENALETAVVAPKEVQTSYTCHDTNALTSAHPYENGKSLEWLYSAPGATTMYVTFSTYSVLANDGDAITIYGGIDSTTHTVVGVYTGSQLAGKTVVVPGNALKIDMVTNGTLNDYGFAVVNIATDLHPTLAVSFQSNIPTVYTGSTFSVSIQQESGWNIWYVIYRVMDSSGRQVSSKITDSLSFSASISIPGDYYLVAIVYDGLKFTSCNSNTFSVVMPAKCAISLGRSAGTVTAGQNITITTTQSAGEKIFFYRYTITDSTGTIRAMYDTGSSTYVYTVPRENCFLYADVLAYDGYSWAYAISGWFSVTTPDPLEVSVSTDETSPTVGKAMVFTATYTGGYAVIFNRFTVRTYSGITLYTTDTASSSINYNPVTAGLCYMEVLSYDGSKWAQAFRWFYVGTFRALLIGQSYAHSPGINTLSGPPNDAEGMQRMISRFSTLRYNTIKSIDLSGSGILSAISSAFAGAQPGDVSLFYFSGHGASGGYLVGTDGINGLISPAQLRSALDAIPGQKIVIVDTCYSGAIINKANRINVGDENASEDFTSSFISAFTQSTRTLDAGGYYVITAAHSDEYSNEGSVTSGGATKVVGFFTYELCRGCGWNYVSETGNNKYADSDNNNLLTLNEVYSYAYSHALDHVSTQHAQVYPASSSYTLFY